MVFSKNLQERVLFQILSVVILMVGAIGVFVGVSNRVVATRTGHENAKLEAQINAQRLKTKFDSYLAYSELLSAGLTTVIGDTNISVQQQFTNLLSVTKSSQAGFKGVWILWNNNKLNEFESAKKGWILLEKGSEGNTVNVINEIPAFESRFGSIVQNKTNALSNVYSVGNELFLDLASPIYYSGNIIGYTGVNVNLKTLNNYIQEQSAFENGFLTIVSNNGVFLAHNNTEFIGQTFDSSFPVQEKEFSVTSAIKAGKKFNFTTEHNGEEYYSVFEPIQIVNVPKSLALEVTQPMGQILREARNSVMRSVVFALFAVVLIVIVVWRVTKNIVNPIKRVTKNLQLLSVGNTSKVEEVKINTKDELYEMAESLNKVVASTKLTEEFALEIGHGNMDVEFNPLSEDDQLGDALLQMRKSLRVSKEEENKRKEEEAIRYWSNEGIAKFSDILRNNNDDLNKLGSEFLRNLVDHLNVNQAALFVLSDDDDQEKPYFELVNAIAFGREKMLKKEIFLGEGLVGRCAFEKKSIYITDVPEDYHEVTSGLGTAAPKCVFIVPCVLNDEVYSVIEIAAFTPLKDHEIEFVEKLSESIASTISSVRINEKTSRLLGNSQKQSEELAAQEEELRQNLEEMEATQEDLQRQMRENAQMRESLKEQNVLLDALLTSLPDFIYFKDKDSKFLRVSKSMLSLFKADSEQDIIGKSDFDFQAKEDAQKYYDDEQHIMNTRNGFINQLQKETKLDGTTMWSSVTKMPLIDEDDNVFGTFGISKDVTEIKELELETKKHGEEAEKQRVLLEALLKTLPDFIYFKDKDSKFLRISNSMLSLFNAKTVDDVIGKSDFDFQDQKAAQEYYNDEQNIIATKKGFTDKLQREVHLDGSEHWTTVTKLPLLDNDGNAIGTYGISKDVTKIKKLELESKLKNEELQTQEEELRQNLEEMKVIQEDLKKQMDLNKKTNMHLEEEKLLLDALMNDLPDYIYFKDKDSKFIRISQSMTFLFGVDDAKDIIGKSDFDFQTPENAQKYFDDEQRIIRTRKGIFDQLQKEALPDGTIIWNLVTKLPLLDEKGKAVGTFGVSKDVTKVYKNKA